MTTYVLPSPVNDTGDSLRWERIERAKRLCERYLGVEPVITDDGTKLSVTFTPDLTADEVKTLRAIVRLSAMGMATPAEVIAVEPDVVAIKAFMALPSPTNAQTLAAVKAIVRVLGVYLVRDE